tara:strand:+ start:1944 stop:5036 length:3093 start_codon:yes stop_codon:yes gene_type:complete
MIYEVELPDGRVIEVEGEPGKEKEAAFAAKKYLAQEAGGKALNETEFDYETGIQNASLRAQLDTADSIIEKESVLQGFVGSDGFIRDANGRLAVTPEGQKRLNIRPSDKNIIIDEEGFSIYDFADFAGTVGPIAGAIAAISPQGKLLKAIKPFLRNQRLTNSAAVAIGSAGGKGVEEAGELLLGTQEQEASEIAKDLAYEGVIGGVSQGVFEVAGAGLYAMLGRKAATKDVDIARAIASGADPNDIAMLNKRLGRTATYDDIKQAQADGVIKTFTAAAVSQRALGRSIPGRIQAAAETVFGRTERDKRLVQYGTERLQRFLEKQGDTSLSLDDFSQAIQTGRLTINQVDELVEELAKKSKMSQRSLDDYIEGEIKLINDGALMGDPDRALLSNNLRLRIQEAYERSFGNYNGVDGEFVKRSQVIDKFLEANNLDAWKGTVTLKVDNIIDVLKKLEKTKPGLELLQQVEGVAGGSIGKVRQIFEKAKTDGLTIEGLNQLRSTILTIQRTAPSSMKEVGYALRRVNDQIDDIFDNLANDTITGNMLAQGGGAKDFRALKSAAKQIRAFNKDYQEAIEPFNNVIITKIRKEASVDGFDVDQIYNFVIKKDRPENLRKILNAITDEPGREAAKKELQKNFVREAVINSTDDLGRINPSAFAKEFKNKLGSTKQALFGDDIPLERILNDFTKIKTNVKAAKLDGVIDGIKDKGLQKSLDDLIRSENELNAAETNKLFKRIQSSEPEEIVRTLFRNGQASNIERMRGIVDKDTFSKIQQDSMRELLKAAKGPGKRVDEVFQPDALERALNSRGDDTLRAMFGTEEVKALRGLVNDLRVMTTGEKGGAGTLIAGAIAVNAFNIAMLPTLVQLGVMGSIMRQPSIVRRFAKADKESINIVMQAFKDALRLTPFIAFGEQVVETSGQLSDAVKNQGTKLIEESGIDLEQVNLGEKAERLNKEFQTLTAPLRNQTSSLNLNIPDIQPIANAPTQAPMSRSLLGGSIANEDIAARMNANRGGLVSKRSAIDQEIAELMARA